MAGQKVETSVVLLGTRSVALTAVWMAVDWAEKMVDSMAGASVAHSALTTVALTVVK